MANIIKGVKASPSGAVYQIDYESLINKPTIPTKVSDLEQDVEFYDLSQQSGAPNNSVISELVVPTENNGINGSTMPVIFFPNKGALDRADYYSNNSSGSDPVALLVGSIALRETGEFSSAMYDANASGGIESLFIYLYAADSKGSLRIGVIPTGPSGHDAVTETFIPTGIYNYFNLGTNGNSYSPGTGGS